MNNREPLDRFGRPLQNCLNPLCDRKIPQGIMYCCHACNIAHDKVYEIHKDGILGHSERCNQKYKERKGAYND